MVSSTSTKKIFWNNLRGTSVPLFYLDVGRLILIFSNFGLHNKLT